MLPPPPEPPLPRKPLKILCADDNVMLGEAVAWLFAKAGHHAEYVRDGLLAWDRLSGDLAYFDVVVTDHEMPGLNGLELVDLLRQAGYRGRIVVHSAMVSPKLEQSYHAFRVDAILSKLRPGDDFVARIEKLVD